MNLHMNKQYGYRAGYLPGVSGTRRRRPAVRL